MRHSRVLHQFHLLTVVKNQGIIALIDEKTVCLPLSALQQFRLLPFLNRQRETDTLTLQLAVVDEIEKEIIKQLVGSLGQRIGFQYSLHRSGTGSQTVGGISRLLFRHLLILVTLTCHHQQHGGQKHC